MTAADDTAADVERAAFIHREILQLGVLILVAIAAFFLTRAVAASNHDMNLRDAAEWYRRGQQAIERGRINDAVEAFRRASVRNRKDKTYVLALARALELHKDDEAARSVLLALRESAPEDADVNLELARLAAHRQDITEALRFYHNALYAPWPVELADARRRIRFELIRFLLAHDQPGRAQSELLAASTDLPDEAPAHVQAGQLFAQAGDYNHALDHFQRALRLSPADAAALAGAGHSAFELGNYTLARSYLRRVPAGVGDVAITREITELVLSNDPLANRIGSTERGRRLRSDLQYAHQRLTACAARHPAGQASGAEAALESEAEAFEDRLRPPAALDQDTIEAGLDLADRIARHVVDACGPATPFDRALVLIGREHGSDAR